MFGLLGLLHMIGNPRFKMLHGSDVMPWALPLSGIPATLAHSGEVAEGAARHSAQVLPATQQWPLGQHGASCSGDSRRGARDSRSGGDPFLFPGSSELRSDVTRTASC